MVLVEFLAGDITLTHVPRSHGPETYQQNFPTRETKIVDILVDFVLSSVFPPVHPSVLLAVPPFFLRDQIVALARFVAEKLGGAVNREELAAFSWELPLAMIRKDLNANIIPLGMLKRGTFFHRALLFKVDSKPDVT